MKMYEVYSYDFNTEEKETLGFFRKLEKAEEVKKNFIEKTLSSRKDLYLEGEVIYKKITYKLEYGETDAYLRVNIVKRELK